MGLSLLWVTPYLYSKYGDGVHERALARAMAQVGDNLTVVSLTRSGVRESSKKHLHEMHGVCEFTLPAMPPYFISAFAWALLISVFLVITRFGRRFKAVCVRDIPMACGFVATKWAHGLPVVVRAGSFMSDELHLWSDSFLSRVVTLILRVMEDYTFPRAQLVVAYSQPFAHDLLRRCGVPSCKVVVSSVGVDTELFSRVPRPRKYSAANFIGYAGSMAPWQGLDVLVRAFAIVNKESPESRLVILTQQKPTPSIEGLIRILDLRDKVRFCAVPHAKMPEAYSTIDVFVVPRHQGPTLSAIPMKLLEACAAGKAIIISATPSISSIVTDGQDCLLFEPGDFTELAVKIQTLLRDVQTRTNLGKAARRLAYAYDWKKIAQRLHDHIDCVVHKTRPVRVSGDSMSDSS